MKKNYLLLFAILGFAFSCDKYENESFIQNDIATQRHLNLAIPLDSNAKGSADSYILYAQIGHLGENCPGCVTAGGVTKHVDCQGGGTTCLVSATIAITSLPGDQYNAVTINEYDLTTEDFFLMPDRSLFVELINGGKEELWLNIPEQLAIRDSVTGMFIFNNLFFTSYQVYKNQ